MNLDALNTELVAVLVLGFIRLYGFMYFFPLISGEQVPAMVRAVQTPSFREQLLKLGYDPVGSTAAELANAQRADLARWEKPIKATGITLE